MSLFSAGSISLDSTIKQPKKTTLALKLSFNYLKSAHLSPYVSRHRTHFLINKYSYLAEKEMQYNKSAACTVNES